MKALVYTLLLIISTHVLVLDAMHHEHDGGAAASLEQVQQDLASADVLDKGGDHCCQCHGFMAPADNPFRPPIA